MTGGPPGGRGRVRPPYPHRIGIGILRPGPDAFFVLEDNCRTPSAGRGAEGGASADGFDGALEPLRGIPLDLWVIGKDARRVTPRRRVEAGAPAFRAIGEARSTALRDGFARIVI